MNVKHGALIYGSWTNLFIELLGTIAETSRVTLRKPRTWNSRTINGIERSYQLIWLLFWSLSWSLLRWQTRGVLLFWIAKCCYLRHHWKSKLIWWRWHLTDLETALWKLDELVNKKFILLEVKGKWGFFSFFFLLQFRM